MLSAFIQTERGYPAMLLVEQLVYQRFIPPGPCVLRRSPLKFQRPR